MRKVSNGKCIKHEATIKRLRNENQELKETINVLSNVGIIKKINHALDDIKHGRYTVR